MNPANNSNKPVKIIGAIVLLLGLVMSVTLFRVYTILYQPVSAETQYDSLELLYLLPLGLLGPILIAGGIFMLRRAAKGKSAEENGSDPRQ